MPDRKTQGKIMDTQMTAAELAAEKELTVDAMRKRWRELFPKKTFDKHAELSAEQIETLSHPPKRGRPGKTEQVKARKDPPKVKQPVSARIQDPGLSIPKVSAPAMAWALLAIVYFHALLIAYDAYVLWSYPGAFGGVVALLFVHAAVMAATQPKYSDTAFAAVWLVSLIDIGAWFLHYPTFLPMSKTGDLETAVFCGFVCACSFAALWLYRYFKTEKYLNTTDEN